MSHRRHGFTLLELMVVVTLMAVAIGMVTVNAQALSDAARLRSAASVLTSVYDLARTEASASGLPRSLLIDARGCLVGEPVLREEVWSWDYKPRITLPARVRVKSISPAITGGVVWEDREPWRLVIVPGDFGTNSLCMLSLSNGTSGVFHLGDATEPLIVTAPGEKRR